MTASGDTSSTKFIENLMEELCEKIRSGKHPTLYGELIADSIEDAIHACFPLLRRVVGDLRIRSWIGDFMHRHACVEPQFFHIATEFARFANDIPALSEVQRKLMEYEWLLLATEVDNASVPASEEKISARALWHGKACLGINPTLLEISLPFDIDEVVEDKQIGPSDETYFYAVYRSSKHRVYSQRLSDFDRHILASIREKQIIDREYIEQFTHQQACDAFVERWLSHFCKTDAVIFTRKIKES